MLLLSSVLCGVVATDTVTFPATTPPLSVPSSVQWVFRTLDDLDDEDAARLFDRPRLRPFLLNAALGDDPPTGRGFHDAYARHLAERNADRVLRWQEAGRIDLIAEAGVVGLRGGSTAAEPFLAELSDAVRGLVAERLPTALANHLPGGKDAADGVTDALEGANKLGFRSSFPPFGLLPDAVTPDGGRTVAFGGIPLYSLPRRKKGNLELNSTYSAASYFADRIDCPGLVNHNRKAYVTSSGFNGIDRSQWGRDFEHTLLVSNGPVKLSTADGRNGVQIFSASAIVVDGDVELADRGHRAAVVIARGDIRLHGDLTHQLSLFVAGGRVIADRQGKCPSCVVLAESGIRVGKGQKVDPDEVVGTQLTGVGPADLGVRWFAVADVGLELRSNGRREVVKAVDVDSPFYGRVQQGDVLRSVNDIPVRTAEQVRTALRRAVVLGVAVVEFDRGAETFWHVVSIADVMK